MKSRDAGPTGTPILEETIGANFERIVAQQPDAEAVVDVMAGRRWTYAELNAEGRSPPAWIQSGPTRRPTRSLSLPWWDTTYACTRFSMQ
ncbi:MAG: fatty-acyl-CoA synthase [Mycobacterium sp.]|jgi:non-ribosomal peptide synthetase component F|nr:fatty-acyl-CoA synthase [Mycobacterium sp.]